LSVTNRHLSTPPLPKRSTHSLIAAKPKSPIAGVEHQERGSGQARAIAMGPQLASSTSLRMKLLETSQQEEAYIMLAHARVAVIGGGITGCAVLYHLAKMGWKDVVLIERSELTSGSSWHAAGSLYSLTSPSSAVILQKYTRDLYPVIEREGEQDVGYHTCGGMALARSADELKKLKILRNRCLRNGIPSEFISMEEVKRCAPVINTEGLLAALYEPEKGYVDPASATKRIRARGPHIRRHHLPPHAGHGNPPDGQRRLGGHNAAGRGPLRLHRQRCRALGA
jgi:FAD dependent oxidoreductase